MTPVAHRLPSATLTKTAHAPNTCRLGSALTSRDEAVAMIEAGMSAPMSITDARGRTGYYWLSVLKDGEKVVGYRLVSDDEQGVVYDVTADFQCDCPGSLRHGSECKHMKTLVALKSRKLIP